MLHPIHKLLARPNRIHFQSINDIEKYQEKRILLLAKSFNLKLKDLDTSIQDCHSQIYSNEKELFPMRTSGTLTGISQEYKYPNRLYYQIENYHFERICHFNSIKVPGTMIKFIATRIDKPDGLQGPFRDQTMSQKNITYHLRYHSNVDGKFWERAFYDIGKLNPSLIQCRPSDLDSFRHRLYRSRAYPILLTGENAYPHILKSANRIFNGTIDKMRCWDGGLSFFQCHHGIRHINDELSRVENIDGKLISTDFFNHAQLFNRYWNGDIGKTKIDLCKCGIFGTQLEEFDGKYVEAIQTSDGKRMPGSSVMKNIYTLFVVLGLENRQNIHFKLIQKPDNSIEFVANFGPLEKTQKYVSQYITRFTGQKAAMIYDANLRNEQCPGHRLKRLIVRSDSDRVPELGL